MYNVGGYGNYNVSKNYNYVKNSGKKTEEKENPDFLENLQQTGKPEKTYDGFKIESAKEKTGELSNNAKEYLKKLKEKFPGMDFIIADFSTDEEADALLAKGKGEYNALITPDLLEKMAADESVAAEYEGIIETSVADMKSAKEQLGDDADMIEKLGVSVDSEGNVTYRAKLIEGLLGDDESDTVTGSTIEELLKRLNEVKEKQAEKLEEIRAKKAEEAEKTEKAKKTEETKENDEEVTFSDVERIAAGVVDMADELKEVTKFADFNADA